MKTYSLRILQAAYLPITLAMEKGKVCGHCWKSEENCDCESKLDIKNDYFLNMNEKETVYV